MTRQHAGDARLRSVRGDVTTRAAPVARCFVI
jgi:hypothetical protein